MFTKLPKSTHSIVTLVLFVSVSAFFWPTHQVHAGLFDGLFGGLGLGSTEATQQLNNAELAVSATQETISAANSGIIAGAATTLAAKEAADGIAWQVAKKMVSNMTKSLIEWVNSGFEGNPAFITDLNGMLLDALDSTAGSYIQSLGGIGEFVCSPFKLDVQVALQLNYAQARSGMPAGASAPECSLTDIENNISGFLNGIGDHGWQEWLSITSNPQNTPYGAYLAAEAKMNLRLVNESGQSLTEANWGQGFLSKKVCEGINGQPAETGKNCQITTPGQVISQQLNYQLTTSQQSLIEADEINELIGALMNQLTLKAVEGINGILGLGGNSNYTDYTLTGTTSSNSYLDDANNEIVPVDTSIIKAQMDTSLAIEQSYYTLINETIIKASAATGTAATVEVAEVLAEATAAKTQVMLNVIALSTIVLTYEDAEASATPTISADEIRGGAALSYTDLVTEGDLSDAATVETRRYEWGKVLN